MAISQQTPSNGVEECNWTPLWEAHDRWVANHSERTALPELTPTKPIGWERAEERGCTLASCEKCSRVRSNREIKMHRDEDALAHVNTGEESNAFLKDSTARDEDYYEVQRYEVSSNRTTWRKTDVRNKCNDPDMTRWEEMWYWQTGQKGSGKVTSRGICDDESRRETADKLHVAECLAGRLGCSDHQVRRIKSILARLNVGHLGYYSDNVTATLAVIDTVTEDCRAYTEWDTQRENYQTRVSPTKRVWKLVEDIHDTEEDNRDNPVIRFLIDVCSRHEIRPKDIRGAQEAINKQLN